MEMKRQFIAHHILRISYMSRQEGTLMKERYENPKMDIVEFDVEDVIATSGGLGEGGQEINYNGN